MDSKFDNAYRQLSYILEILKDAEAYMPRLEDRPERRANNVFARLDDMYKSASALEDIFWKSGFYDD